MYGPHTEGSVGGVRFRSSAWGETTAARLHSRGAGTKLYGGLRSCPVVDLSLALVDTALEAGGSFDFANSGKDFWNGRART